MKCTMLALLMAALVGTPLVALATPENSAVGGVAVAGGDEGRAIRDSNSLETREFHFHNARLPGNFSSHQEVTAWQVTQGSWNGQSLGGLYLVLVQTTSDDGRSAAHTNCYVSDFATSAQRQALLTAFLATNPNSIQSGDASSLRLEPAVITVEVEGQELTLHLGLVA
jgi:hypothetical protein